MFNVQALAYYATMGTPAISTGTFWDIYLTLLAHFRSGPEDPRLDEAFHLANLADDDEVELIEGL